MKYFQTDDRDDYFASLDSNRGPKVYPTFRISKDGVIVHASILGKHAAAWAKGTFKVTSRYVERGRWKDLATENGYLVENLKTGHVGPDPTTKKLPVICTCGRTMVVRTNKTDKSAFYGCTAFPKCRNTRKL